MITVGTVVKLLFPCLGNEAGTYGVGFNDYDDGCQVIFKNGNYDGFSLDEQKDLLLKVGFDYEVAEYNFRNVMQLSEDFRKGVFDSIWK
jgi:hypothetical protein